MTGDLGSQNKLTRECLSVVMGYPLVTKQQPSVDEIHQVCIHGTVLEKLVSSGNIVKKVSFDFDSSASCISLPS